VFKKIARTSAIVLALTVPAIQVTQVHAQAPVVTGGNPVPTGENCSIVSTIVCIVLGALSSV
jgi:hypothetical protein